MAASRGPVLLEARLSAGQARVAAWRRLLRMKPRPIRKASYCILSETRELRIAPRLRARLRYATIADLRQRAFVECAVQDVSDTGARLLTPARALLPARFLLVEEEGRAARLAELVWRRGGACGVRWVSRGP